MNEGHQKAATELKECEIVFFYVKEKVRKLT